MQFPSYITRKYTTTGAAVRFKPMEPPWQAIRAWIPADDNESPTDRPNYGTKPPAQAGKPRKSITETLPSRGERPATSEA